MNINCSVCTELFLQAVDICSTPCGHVFHHACLLQWIESSSTCPQCRKTTTAANIFKIYFNFSDTEGMLKNEIEKIKTKCAQTDALLKNTEEKLKIKCDEISQLTINNYEQLQEKILIVKIALLKNTEEEVKLKCDEISQLTMNNYEKRQKQIREMKVSRKKDIDQFQQKRQVKVGDLVVIKDSSKAPLEWNIGDVIDKCPENNETVTLKTNCGEIKRNIGYLLPLDLLTDRTQWQAKEGQWVVIRYVTKEPLQWNLGVVDNSVNPHPESGRVNVRMGSVLSNDVMSFPQERLFPLPYF